VVQELLALLIQGVVVVVVVTMAVAEVLEAQV
jgi:hypothetical protein